MARSTTVTTGDNVNREPSRRTESIRPDRLGSQDFATVRPGETHDPVASPKHYRSHPSGVECITITEHYGFNIGNAIKYLWRSEHKNGLEDLKKARWYVDREIQRLEALNGYAPRV